KLVDIEHAHTDLTELRIVHTMDERKALMAELSDAFVMLPGGTGSLDEFFEMFTLMQLGYQNKPCAILNINGYYDHLITFLDHATQEGFLVPQQREKIITSGDDVTLLERLMSTI
ncbi:MAG TPA: TIGR00730 family Rossman fold protein, partial [Legionellaceae bacterium]|nr:TIGR00730 family Rossman fold protein [Legionellaceae bacterium]